jgi:hypothetical protein
MTEKRKLDRDSVGAWLITCNPNDIYDPTDVADARLHVFSWSLAGNYRTELVQPGDEILLWVGGSARRGHVPGVWALGVVIGEVFEGEGDPESWIDKERARENRPYVPMAMTWLEPPLPKTALAEDAVLSNIEVLRMPRMANPSFLSTEEADALFGLVERIYSAPTRQRRIGEFGPAR